MSCLKASQKLLIGCCRKQEAGIDKPDISRLSCSFLKNNNNDTSFLNKNILGSWYYNKVCKTRITEECLASLLFFFLSLLKCIVSQAKVGKSKSYGVVDSYSICL